MSVLMLFRPITAKTVEEAYRRARTAQEQRRQSWADRGMRAARARDPHLLLALQKGAEILQQISEDQLGVHGHDAAGIRVHATEFNLWREAYTAADRGEPLANFEWIYAAAAWLAGIQD